MRTCEIKGCNNKHLAKGLCHYHYNKIYFTEYGKQYNKQYRQEHKEKAAEYAKRWYRDNKAKELKRSKQHYQDNKEQKYKYVKQYRQTPIGKAIVKASKHKRRTLTPYLTKKTIQRVYKANIAKYGRLTCCLCFKPIKFGDDSLEHLTPISRGGNNDFKNLGIAHRKCNKEKFTKTLQEWKNEQ